MSFYLNSDDDWIESFRRYLYPKLHAPLSSLGKKLGVPLYAIGHVGKAQYVGKFDEDEDAIEDELDDRGERNPIAALKSLKDGRTSEGSWAITDSDKVGSVEPGMQLHFTLFKREDGKPGREMYAHYEDCWRERPIAHLRSKNFSAAKGVEKARQFVNNDTLLTLK